MKQNSGHEVHQLTPMPLNTEAPIFDIHAVSQSQVDKVICGLRNTRAKDTFDMDSLLLKTTETHLRFKTPGKILLLHQSLSLETLH